MQRQVPFIGKGCLVLDEFRRELEQWRRYGKETVVAERDGIPVFANEFWTSKQRAAHSLHEVSYRACFKPQLPRFFIERLTDPGDVVFDPFMGRGTTLLEAVLLGRDALGNDVNPLSRVLVEARLDPPTLSEVAARRGQRPEYRDVAQLILRKTRALLRDAEAQAPKGRSRGFFNKRSMRPLNTTVLGWRSRRPRRPSWTS